MREILFRGKDAESGFWCYGDLSFDREGNPHIRFWAHSGYLVREVDPETVGQFTGFYDKGSKRIFEGDILRSRYDEDNPDDVSYELVQWEGNGWYSGKWNIEDDLRQDMLSEYSELAGNIHDNPELMEVEDNG
ncbi:MAG: hypothetical protein IKZ01_01205 [Anaerotignum sp.]|nr:hypothetical protein [Anaerotignum sp.]